MTKEFSIPNDQCRRISVDERFGHWELGIDSSLWFRNSSLVRPRSAFTLIELILVMALLSIVLAFAAPALSNFFRGRTIDSEARRLVSLIRYGQSRAVSEGVPIILWIDARKNTYGLQQEPGFTDGDSKALNFALGGDLRIEVTDMPAMGANLAGQAARRAIQADPNLSRLRFQPD